MKLPAWLQSSKTSDAANPSSAKVDAPIGPGLYTWPLVLDGGQRRIHLRVEPDGAGVMFIDVTEVIHLNQTATHMAKQLLDGVPQAQIERTMLRQYQGVSKAQLRKDLALITEMVNGVRDTGEGCPACAIAHLADFRPVFSTPVNAPFKVDIALTYACNNTCPHCYNEPGRFTMHSLDLDGWKQVLDKLNHIGVPHIILTGGEPTLHPHLFEIICYADKLGHIVGMNSNGRRLAEPRFAEKLSEAGLNHVQITLESQFADVHDTMVNVDGAWGETVQGIENALAAGLHTITNTTITAKNRNHVVDVVDFLYDKGLRTFAMNGMIYAGGGTETPDALPAESMESLLVGVRDRAEELDMRFLWYTVTDYCKLNPLALDLAPKRCNAAEYSMCIEPNGDVLPCQSYYVSAGNFLNDPWDAIWNSDLFLSFRNREENPQAAGLPEACWDCPDLEMCGGGCRLEREAHAALRPAEHGCARSRVKATAKVTRSSGATPNPF